MVNKLVLFVSSILILYIRHTFIFGILKLNKIILLKDNKKIIAMTGSVAVFSENISRVSLDDFLVSTIFFYKTTHALHINHTRGKTLTFDFEANRYILVYVAYVY